MKIKVKIISHASKREINGNITSLELLDYASDVVKKLMESHKRVEEDAELGRALRLAQEKDNATIIIDDGTQILFGTELKSEKQISVTELLKRYRCEKCTHTDI